MKINIIIQARMSSRRFPGKVLKKFDGYPYSLLSLIHERVKNVKNIDNIILATSLDSSDDILVKEANDIGLKVVRGDLDDVLSRFTHTLIEYECDHVVRITADCPLISPELIDELITLHLDDKNDYTSTALMPNYPDGLDAEIIKTEVLMGIDKKTLSAIDREHVTYYIYMNPEVYKLGGLSGDIDLSHVRLTVDEEIDFVFIEKIIEDLGRDPVTLSYEEIKEFIIGKEPEYFINSKIGRNQGLKKSLEGSGGND